MKAIRKWLIRRFGYRVVAGFGDTVDFEYRAWTAAGALGWMKAHPQECFVWIVNRRGEVVAARW